MHLYQSNRLERLFKQLLANCTSATLDDPFTREIIVVQHPGMAQWLSRQWALSTGIASLLHFPLPARALGELYGRLDSTPRQNEIWQSPVLRWRIQELLPTYKDHPAFLALHNYLHTGPGSEDNATRIFQLAGRIAEVFDQYLIYRPDLLLQWEDRPDEEDWQAILWQQLCLEQNAHQARLHQHFRALLMHNGPSGQEWPSAQGPQGTASASLLPRRLHLFGISSLAPVYLDLFVQLSHHLETHCYQLSPCSQYWHDLAPARKQAQIQAQDALLAFSSPLVEAGNALLTQLGQTGRDFARQLLENGLDDPLDLYEEPQEESLLAELQRQLLYLSPAPEPAERWPVAADDASIQLHVCYSPFREVQALHDALLDCFSTCPGLRPDDILVAAPNISNYGAAIRAVFGEAPPAQSIPWALADQPSAQADSMFHLFLALLDVLMGRCTSTELLDLLEHPALHRRFGLDVAQLPLLHKLVQEAGIRWGLDAAHRRDLGIESGQEHSWRHGLDRLLLGHAMGRIDVLHAGLLPCPPAAEEATAILGALCLFYDTLSTWRLSWQRPRPAQEWPPLLLGLLADCFDQSFENEGLSHLRQVVHNLATELALAGCALMLTPHTLRLRLEECLHSHDGGQAFLSGRVTFCNMVPMRSLPFQVICLLGMNDGDFPRQQHPVSFDHMAKKPRLGDRNRRDDDRYLFLEAIFSARKHLLLSWVGRSQRDGAELPPSVVISELCDYLDSNMRPAANPGTKLSEQLRVEHPLQPFSATNYNGTGKAPSYNPHWLPAALATAPAPFQDGPLPVPAEDRQVELAALLHFWRNPARYFLRHSLGMALYAEEVPVEEAEPFTLDGLEHFHLRQEMAARKLTGQDEALIQQILRAQGRLPQGNFAAPSMDRLTDEAARLTETLHAHLASPVPPLEVRLPLENILLCGWLDKLHDGGRLVWTGGRVSAGLLLETWICHLVLAAVAPAGTVTTSRIVSWESTTGVQQVQFSAMQAEEAATLLRPYVQMFLEGQQEALPFFPKSGLAWAKQIHKDNELNKAHDAACKVWHGDWYASGEREDAAFRLLFPEEAPLNNRFTQLAALFLPLLKALTEPEDAAA